MFINAEPRFVLTGFETFVPIHRAESLHQKLVEMTNNDVNAWSIFRPGFTSTSDNWDQNIDEYSNNENFPAHSLYGGYFQDVSSVAQNQTVSPPRTVIYAPAHQVQCQSFRNVSTSEHTYQEPGPEMNYFERPSPMLGNDYSQLSLGRGRGSFAEFSSVRNVLRNLNYQPQVETSNADLTSISSRLQPSSYVEEAPILNTSINMGNTSPNTVYSSYSPPQTSVDHRTMRSVDTQNSSMSTSKSQCWQGSLRSIGGQSTYEHPFTSDGLPKYQQEQYEDPWAANPGSTADWASQSIAANTISPKMLTLNVSTASLSSSGSSQGSVMALSDSSNAISVVDDQEEFLGPEQLTSGKPEHPVRRPRQILPDSIPVSRRVIPVVPVVPSNDFTSSRSSKKRPMKVAKSSNHSRRRSPPPGSSASPSPSPHLKSDPSSSRLPATPKRIQPKPVDPTTLSQSAATAQAAHHRDAKDDFLVRSKLAGMSYKDIRRQGKFTEAESTLRGRFRTLTKHKTARVRRPEWEEKDINLLKRAVRKLSQGSDPSRAKIPWKQVAEYIANHGGSYHFGNATCRKRWDELQEGS